MGSWQQSCGLAFWEVACVLSDPPGSVLSSDRLSLGSWMMGSDSINNPFQSWDVSTFPLGKSKLAPSWQLLAAQPRAPQQHLGHPEAWPG